METGTPGPPPGPGEQPPLPERPQTVPSPAPADAGVPQLRAGSGPPSARYPVIAEFDRQDEYRRFLPIVKGLLLIPHWVALMFVLLAAAFAIVGAFFAVLFTGKYPRGLHRFITGSYRWMVRVYAYGLLMTDRYPPFSLDDDPEHAARFDIAYQERIANWRPLVQWLLVFPYAIVAGALMWVAYICVFLAFFAILFTKRFPEGLFNFVVVAIRWQQRGSVYSVFMTDRYPRWEWG